MSDSRQYYDSLLEERDNRILELEEERDGLRADLRELEQQVLDARKLMQRAQDLLPHVRGFRWNRACLLRPDIESWLEATKPERKGAK